MKKKIECKLKNIEKVEDISYDDYLLFKQIDANKQNPILSSLVCCLIGLPLIALGVTSLVFAIMKSDGILFFGAIIGLVVGGTLDGVLLHSGISECIQTKTLRKQYKILKKAKAWEKLTSLMQNYENTDNYKEERKIRTIETWEKTIVKLTEEKQQEQMQYIAKAKKADVEISLLKKMIEHANKDESIDEILSSTETELNKIKNGVVVEEKSEQLIC